MFSRCANPDCAASFDYRQGRLFRFHQSHPESQASVNSHSLKHFWLCKACSETYTLEYLKGFGVLMGPRFKVLPNEHVPRLIAAA